MLKVLSLFAGIGGFDLGLERTGGFRTVASCEINPFARSILAKHWPGVPIYDDVRSLTAERLAADGITVDAICGGFPCQDVSLTGSGEGLNGERSGLCFEMLRIIDGVRPAWVIIENVSALRARGLEAVLRGLAAIGYDAEWHCLSARSVGAKHTRDRVFVISYPNGRGWRIQGNEPGAAIHAGTRQSFGHGEDRLVARWPVPEDWQAEPDVGRVVDGISDAMDRRKRLIGLGNSILPLIAENIGRAILARAA